MSRTLIDDPPLPEYRQLVTRIVDGDRPVGRDFDACRQLLRCAAPRESAFQALCMLLEGALADPGLAIDDNRLVVQLLKALGRGSLCAGDLL